MGSRRSLSAWTHASLLLASLATMLAAAPAQAPPDAGDAPPPVNPLFADRDLFRSDQVLLKLEPARGDPLDLADGSELSSVLKRYGATGVQRAFASTDTAQKSAARSRARFPDRAARAPDGGRVPDLENVFLVQLGGPTDVLQAMAAAAALPGVVYAEPNFLYRASANPLPGVSWRPDDRYLSQDDVHWSTGAWQQTFSDLYGIEKLRGMEAWSRFDLDGSGAFEASETRPGEGIVVAVIDSGLDVDHPDIVANVWRNPGEVPDNGIDDDGNGFVDDVLGWDFVDDDPDPQDGSGHGTHVAGTVAARGDNEVGVIGVAPFAELMPVKGLSDSGVGSAVQLANAVRYAADMGADVLSNSWGGTGESAILRAAFQYASSLGAVLVAAGGNSSFDVASVIPAGYDDVIAVAATDAGDLRAGFSNFGSEIDLSAPGVEVLSLNANAGDNNIARRLPQRVIGGLYLYISGTSMACPHVSGAVAVLLSRRPDETPDEIRARLLAGAAPIDAKNPGFETLLGQGRLDLAASLAIAPAPLIEIAGVDAIDLAPGGEADVVIELENIWVPVSGVAAVISTQHPNLSVLKASADFGAIDMGAGVSNEGDAFRVALDSSSPFGEPIPVTLDLTGDDGYRETLEFSLAATQFADVSEKVGLPLFETVPWSVGLHDFDGDRDVDAHLVGFLFNAFFRNVGGAFEFATGTGLITPTVGSAQALFIDIENDGDQDIFWAGFNNFTGSNLFLNDGDGVFSDITDASGTRGLRAFTAAALDYDGDGLIDFLGGSMQRGGGLAGQALFLMRNNGDGTFTDVAEQACLDTALPLLIGQTFTFDYDDDGDPDLLLVSKDRLILYKNRGDGTFKERTREFGLMPKRPKKKACARRARLGRKPCPLHQAFGGSIGDYDNDGDLDIFLTGRGIKKDVRFNTLYRNDGKRGFVNVTEFSGDLATAEITGMPRGNEFFDYDNDGDLDLYVTNEGITEIRSNTLYRNEGDGTFREVTDLAFSRATGPSGAAAAIGDYNGDGALDIYAPSGQLGRGGRGAFFENRFANRNHWLMLRLEGVVSNRDAYGARVHVTAGGRTQMREIHHSAVDSNPVHFGLGESLAVEEIRIRWPSGMVQTLAGSGIDRVLEIVEPTSCDELGVECPQPEK